MGLWGVFSSKAQLIPFKKEKQKKAHSSIEDEGFEVFEIFKTDTLKQNSKVGTPNNAEEDKKYPLKSDKDSLPVVDKPPIKKSKEETNETSSILESNAVDNIPSLQQDTTSLESNSNEIAFNNVANIIYYRVRRGENLQDIAKKFNISTSIIKEANHLKNNILKYKQRLKIPLVANKNNENIIPSGEAPISKIIFYKVKRRETLATIAQKFNTTEEDIVASNNLNTFDVYFGQRLKIETNKKRPVLENTKVESSLDEDTSLNEDSPTSFDDFSNRRIMERKIITNKYGIKEVQEKGLASFEPNPLLSEDKSVALHRTAETGTVIKITNTKNGRSLFVKIIGQIAESDDINKEAIIIISKRVAVSLGVLSPNSTGTQISSFPAVLAYGLDNDLKLH